MSDKRYKVVCKDNFARETVSESWLVGFPVTKRAAITIAEALNESVGPESNSYFKAVPADYKLYKFEP